MIAAAGSRPDFGDAAVDDVSLRVRAGAVAVPARATWRPRDVLASR
jgi:hypothetical protein